MALRNTILCVFLCMGIHSACYAQALPVRIKAEVDKKEATIGETVRYTISVTADKNTIIELPDLTDAFKGLTVIDSKESSSGFINRKTLTIRVFLQTFTPGKYPILKQAVKYKTRQDKDWNTAFTGECAVNIVSVLEKKGSAKGMADIKGPLDLRTSIPVIIILAVIGLISALVFWKKIFPGKKKSVVEIQPWKAHEIAYAGLEGLRTKGLLAKGMIKQYYSELSGILRHYLENRFSLKAPEMTTEEFIVYMREYSELGREQKDLLKEFLFNCDLVKFAKYIPPDSEGGVAFDMVKRFVDQTRLVEVEQGSKLK